MELGRNPVSQHHIQPRYGDEQADAGRETKFSGANADREVFIFPVQLTTSRIGNLTRLIHTLAIYVTIIIIIIYHFRTLARSLEPVVTECKEHTIRTQTKTNG